MTASRLEAVKVREVPDDLPDTNAIIQAAAKAQMQQAVATEMLMTAIKALSQRFVVALSNLFTLITVASAFYLWAMSIDTISTLKIIGLSIYSAFILALNMWGRRK